MKNNDFCILHSAQTRDIVERHCKQVTATGRGHLRATTNNEICISKGCTALYRGISFNEQKVTKKNAIYQQTNLARRKKKKKMYPRKSCLRVYVLLYKRSTPTPLNRPKFSFRPQIRRPPRANLKSSQYISPSSPS